MAKVLLVEDDNNLREIYQARLTAEGYDIVTAQNGEEALVVAKQNKPDLIISDVMMPRISGFEMLDILRNTDELKHTRVIMLTALGQADDQKRANSLGADRYLVKSQVTLEDIVNSAKDLLTEDGSATPTPATADASAPSAAAPSIPAVEQATDTNPAPMAPTIESTPVQPDPTAAAPDAAQPTPAPEPAGAPAADSALAVAPTPQPVAAQPATDSTQTPAADPAVTVPEPSGTGPSTPATPPSPAAVDSVAQGLEAEEAALQAQIASYSNGTTAPAEKASTEAADAASNDQAIADAVKQLNNATDTAPAQPPSAAEAPVEPAPAPVADPTPAPEPVATAAAPAANVGDSAQVAGKKIIQPITDTSAKPDINALLAKEEAKDITSQPAAPVVNGSPAQPPQSPPASGQPFDPNNAL